ncbi:Beta-lactamase-like protein 2, partial [Coemansia aciculifera]
MDKSLAVVEKVSKGIVRVLGLNPGPFTLQGTNTYIVGTGLRRILVDTGDGLQPEYYPLLKQCLDNSRIGQILLTHWHGDHIGGVNRLLAMPDIVSGDCTVHKRFDKDTDEQPEVKRMLAGAVEHGRLRDIVDSQEFAADGGLLLRAVFTPGHTSDHCAFTVTGNGGGLMLLTGDHILGQGTTIVHELRSYMKSLDRVLQIRPTALLPAH